MHFGACIRSGFQHTHILFKHNYTVESLIGRLASVNQELVLH
jgi:hypothetical protein